MFKENEKESKYYVESNIKERKYFNLIKGVYQFKEIMIKKKVKCIFQMMKILIIYTLED